jgi:hypothetical protein
MTFARRFLSVTILDRGFMAESSSSLVTSGLVAARNAAGTAGADPWNQQVPLKCCCDVDPTCHRGVVERFRHGTQHLLYGLVFGCKSLSTSHTVRRSGTRDRIRRHSTQRLFLQIRSLFTNVTVRAGIAQSVYRLSYGLDDQEGREFESQ